MSLQKWNTTMTLYIEIHCRDTCNVILYINDYTGTTLALWKCSCDLISEITNFDYRSSIDRVNSKQTNERRQLAQKHTQKQHRVNNRKCDKQKVISTIILIISQQILSGVDEKNYLLLFFLIMCIITLALVCVWSMQVEGIEKLFVEAWMMSVDKYIKQFD